MAINKCRGAAAILAASFAFAAVVGAGGAGAQNEPDSVPLQEVAERDDLIADQEALLNVYRCLFDADTQIVPGGCVDGHPRRPAAAPAEFTGTPTVGDVAVRDHLVQDQESLLNVYRCLFDVDTQIVPGGCVDGKPFDPTAPPGPSGPDAPPTVPTGFDPGDSGPAWSVDGDGHLVLSRLVAADEGADTFVAAGFSREQAERSWALAGGAQGAVGGIDGRPRGARYEFDSPMKGISDAQMVAWAQACVDAYEDAGVPEFARRDKPDHNRFWDVPGTPAGLAATCSRAPHHSGGWNHAIDILNADPDCIYDHAIEFMPVRARSAAGLSYADQGYSSRDFWWGNHCQMSVTHPLGSELVLGPFGGVDQWTYDLQEQLEATLLGDWAPRKGNECSTGVGLLGNFTDPDGVRRPLISGYLFQTLAVINSGRACWRPGTEPWTTAELDRLGIQWARFGTEQAVFPVGTLRVWMRFLPDPHPHVQGHSSPATLFHLLTQ